MPWKRASLVCQSERLYDKTRQIDRFGVQTPIIGQLTLQISGFTIMNIDDVIDRVC